MMMESWRTPSAFQIRSSHVGCNRCRLRGDRRNHGPRSSEAWVEGQAAGPADRRIGLQRRECRRYLSRRISHRHPSSRSGSADRILERDILYRPGLAYSAETAFMGCSIRESNTVGHRLASYGTAPQTVPGFASVL